jgi:hypothetical protein
MERDNTVGIENGYGLDDRGVGVRVSVKSKIFSFPTSFRPALGPNQPPTQGYKCSFPEGKKVWK